MGKSKIILETGELSFRTKLKKAVYETNTRNDYTGHFLPKNFPATYHLNVSVI